MWHAASEEQKNPYDIPCSREQTWIKIDFTKRPLISCKNELYPHKESRRFKCSTWHIYFPLSPYIYCHFIFTTISNQFRRLGCFGLVLCFLVFNSDNKANDWWVPCAYFGCVWHPDPLPGDWYLPNTLKYFELCCFWKRRLRPRQTFGGCVLIWSRISCEIFHSLLAFSGVFFFLLLPPSFLFPVCFTDCDLKGSWKQPHSREKSDRSKKRLEAACAVCAETKGGFGKATQPHQRRQFTGAVFLSVSSAIKKKRERGRKTAKKKISQEVCVSLGSSTSSHTGEKKMHRDHTSCHKPLGQSS